MPERKHAGAPSAVLARPLSLASYPVATGRPRPGHQRPHARVRRIKQVNAGRRNQKTITTPPRHRLGGPIRSSSIAPPKPINHNYAAPDSSAPTRPKGSREPVPKNAGEKARRSPLSCLGATPLVGELPRSNGQTTAWPSAPSRALRVTDKVNAGTRCCFGATQLVGELPRSNGQTTA